MIPTFLRSEYVPYASVEIVQVPARVLCAWCPDFDRTAPQNHGASHGMCASCCAKWHAEMDALEAGQA